MNPPLRLEVSQPVLDFYEMEKIRHIERYTGGKFRSFELDITYPSLGKDAVEARLASLCAQAEDACARLLDHRDFRPARGAGRVAIPALLPCPRSISTSWRRSAYERGSGGGNGLGARGAHFALLGLWAEAVHPYSLSSRCSTSR